MPRLRYSLTFKLGQVPLKLTIYRLLKIFGYSLAITRLERVHDGSTVDSTQDRKEHS
jgi:hypothetical protein